MLYTFAAGQLLVATSGAITQFDHEVPPTLNCHLHPILLTFYICTHSLYLFIILLWVGMVVKMILCLFILNCGVIYNIEEKVVSKRFYFT